METKLLLDLADALSADSAVSEATRSAALALVAGLRAERESQDAFADALREDALAFRA